MRVSRDVAAQNRRTVVEGAGRSFREHGYDGIGIAALMKTAGLTHGGFYKQFQSKETLAVEATAGALRDNLANWRDALDGLEGDPLAAFADWYLSRAHVQARDNGCAFAALAAEAPRHGPEMGRVFAEGLENWVAAISDAAPDGPTRCQILKVLSTMVGALILARAVADEPLGQEVLDCAKADL